MELCQLGFSFHEDQNISFPVWNYLLKLSGAKQVQRGRTFILSSSLVRGIFGGKSVLLNGRLKQRKVFAGGKNSGDAVYPFRSRATFLLQGNN
jgi:hypothetical protein